MDFPNQVGSHKEMFIRLYKRQMAATRFSAMSGSPTHEREYNTPRFNLAAVDHFVDM